MENSLNKERAITYSLLAHIRNTQDIAKGPIDFFVPLIKRALSKINKRGVFKGKSLFEIKEVADDLYKIDFPIPVLKKILDEIAMQINDSDNTHLVLYNDGAFSISKYAFTDLDDLIIKQKKEVEGLEELFQEFCDASGLDIKEKDSIFNFIEKNKFTLSRYLAENNIENGIDFSAEAQFVDFFRQTPIIYDKIKEIYIGSIVVAYLEYSPKELKNKVELILDTNFIVSLLDLNTPESTHTCLTLISISKNQGFSISVFDETLEETKSLLDAKAHFFQKSFLQKKVSREDVYNACGRRGLNKADLERISDNVEKEIKKLGVSTLYLTDKLKNKAKISEDYEIFKALRNSSKSALHDAAIITYIKEKRGKRIKEFGEVNVWFVNNSADVGGSSFYLREGYQPESIKADDLLNILWLSSPQINKQLNAEELAEIGLTSIISNTFSKNLPKSSVLRALDENIHKYAKEEISDVDILRVATRITNKQLTDIEELNRLAENDKVEFVKRLDNEAEIQRGIEESRARKLEEALSKLEKRTRLLEQAEKNYNKKTQEIERERESGETNAQLTNVLLRKENEIRRLKRKEWIRNELNRWRRKTWIEFVIGLVVFLIGVLFILIKSNWNIDNALNYYKDIEGNIVISSILSLLGLFFWVWTIMNLFNKYRDQSNIKSFIDQLDIPEDLQQLTNIEDLKLNN